MKPKIDAQLAQVFAVACTDLHIVIGPFKSVKAAELVAQMSTEKMDGCKYVVIPMVTMIPAEEVASKKGDKDDGHPGLYL